MNSKKLNITWSVSLLVIGISAIVLLGSKIIGIELNDIIIRIIGVIDLLALPVFVFTTIQKAKRK